MLLATANIQQTQSIESTGLEILPEKELSDKEVDDRWVCPRCEFHNSLLSPQCKNCCQYDEDDEVSHIG